MNELNMRGIPRKGIEQLWHYAEPYIKRALDHANGELTLADFKHLCLDGSIQLWLINRGNRVVGAVTTEIINYPQRKHCRVITLAGSDFSSWVGLVDATLAAWATELGCHAIESYVRKGLVAKLDAFGYKHKHSVLVKPLKGEM